jgi:clathrin heavy chain
MPDAVVFWTWINPTEIAIVTNKSVFHWSTADATSDPVKIFDRLPSLNEHQIINYHADSTGKWLVLIGIAPVVRLALPLQCIEHLY